MKRVIIALLSAIAGAVAGISIVIRITKETKEKSKALSEKHLALFLLMDKWVRVNQENKHISEYLSKQGYKKIAIYGMSYVGETLFEELRNSDISVAYCIDKNADSIYSEVEVKSIEDELDEVDAVIVTAVTYYDEIKEMLSDKVGCPVVSLEDILYDV